MLAHLVTSDALKLHRMILVILQLQPTPMYIPSMWGCVFLLINLTQIGILLLERREVSFPSGLLSVGPIIILLPGCIRGSDSLETC